MTTLMTIQDHGAIGIGTTTPNLLNGANYPGKVFHIVDNYQASFGVDTSGGWASFVLNDSAAPFNKKLFEIDVNGGYGKLFFKSGTDAGDLLNTMMTMLPTGEVGVGTSTPTATLHIKAGTVMAGSVPIKFTSGALNTVPEPGALEFFENKLYITGSDGVRRTIATCTL